MWGPYITQDPRLRARTDMLPAANKTLSDTKQPELAARASLVPTMNVLKDESVEPTSLGSNLAMDNSSNA